MTDAEREALFLAQHDTQNIGKAAADAGNFFFKTVEELKVCPVCAFMTMGVMINEHVVTTNLMFAPKVLDALAQMASRLLQRQVAFVVLESADITSLDLNDIIKPTKVN